MAAWKSSDGGSIGTLGQSSYVAAANTTNVTIVSAAANVRGVIIRAALIDASNGGNGSLLAGTMTLLRAWDVQNQVMVLNREIFVPAGLAVIAGVGLTSNIGHHISYDLL